MIFSVLSQGRRKEMELASLTVSRTAPVERLPKKYTLFLRLPGQSLNVLRDELTTAVCFTFLPKIIIKNNYCLISA